MGEEFFRGELATLLEYGAILKKKRIPEAEEAVKQILQDEQNMIARINRIKEIDRKYENMNEGELRQLSEIKIKEVEENPPVFKRVSFFNYFFAFRKMLIRYCNDLSVMTPGFLGMKFTVSNEAISLLDEIRNNTYKNILPVLQKVLENGWKVLPPSLYNVFFYLNNFLSIFLKRFIMEKKDIQKNFDFVESFGKDFFTLLSKKRYMQEIREGIYLFYGNKENEEMANFILFFEALFNKNKKFSFLNYIIMVYSVYYRQPLSLEKIMENRELPLIEQNKYLSSDRVKFIFKEYMDKIKKKQEIVEKKLFYLQFVMDEQPNLLEDFIKANASPKFKMEFFMADLMRSTADFLKGFINYIKPIFLGEITLVKEGSFEKTSIFRMLWESLVTRLEESNQEISYSNETNKYLFITLSKYEKYLESGRKLSSEKDEKLCDMLNTLSDTLYSLYEVLVKVLYSDYKLKNLESKELIFDKIKSRNRPISETEDDRFIPYSDYNATDYGNITVCDVLSEIATVAATYLYLLEYDKIKEILKEKNPLIEESKRNIENILRIS